MHIFWKAARNIPLLIIINPMFSTGYNCPKGTVKEQNHVYKTNKSAKIKVFAGKALQLPEIGVTIHLN